MCDNYLIIYEVLISIRSIIYINIYYQAVTCTFIIVSFTPLHCRHVNIAAHSALDENRVPDKSGY